MKANHPGNDATGFDPKWAWQPFVPAPERAWDRRLAAHLFRRAAFSATNRQLDEAVESGLPQTLEQLFNTDKSQQFDAEMSATARYLDSGSDVRRVSAWWMLRMIQSPTPLIEKMTLFWHGHFATSGAKVDIPAAMLEQNQKLRQFALSKFEPLVQAISRDVAMLVYLDSTENRKTRPNENYARELMELFCLGLDRYTEHDIKEVARCFTGWEVRRVSGGSTFQFNSNQHDTHRKAFLGASGNFGGEQAVRVVLSQPDSKLFIAKKLIRFFVYDDVPITDELAQPIASRLAETDFDIGVAVRQILASNLFYSDQAIGRKIRSPIELAVGLLRQLQATADMNRLLEDLEQLGQLPLFPPNVKGWDGGRRWLNASTILGRANLVRRFSRLDGIKLQHKSLSEWRRKNDAPAKAENLVDWLAELMVAPIIPADSSLALTKIVDDAPDGDAGMQQLLTAFAVLPEFHLN